MLSFPATGKETMHDHIGLSMNELLDCTGKTCLPAKAILIELVLVDLLLAVGDRCDAHSQLRQPIVKLSHRRSLQEIPPTPKIPSL